MDNRGNRTVQAIRRKQISEPDLQDLMQFVEKGTTFFFYIRLRLFRTKNLQSPGTYISKRTWDPSQKAITKQTDS